MLTLLIALVLILGLLYFVENNSFESTFDLIRYNSNAKESDGNGNGNVGNGPAANGNGNGNGNGNAVNAANAANAVNAANASVNGIANNGLANNGAVNGSVNSAVAPDEETNSVPSPANGNDVPNAGVPINVANNGAANNGMANNGAANNGMANNGMANNGAANNGSTVVPVDNNHQGASNNFAQAGGNDGSGSSDGSTGVGHNDPAASSHLPNNTLISNWINNGQETIQDAKSLLPKESNNEFFPDDVQPNFDESYDYMIGIDTVGQSLKNASHDIRGTVPCPKINGVSPWGNSSIEPDYNIAGLGCN